MIALPDLDVPPPPLPRLDARAGVFSRLVTTPSGPPWEQARIAELDARLGAPMPIATLAIRLVRLTPWRPRSEARFAIFYARAEAVRAGLTVERQIEGRSLKITFRSRAEQARRLRMSAAATAAGFACIVVIGTATAKAVAARTTLRLHLAGDVRTAAIALRQSRAAARESQVAIQVRAAGLEGHAMADLLEAIAGAGVRRKPEASVTGFHWDHAYVALETDGPDMPIQGLAGQGRQIKNVGWLWGLGELSGERRPTQ